MSLLQRLSFVSETCNCQKVFTTNWWQLTPYTTHEDNTAVGIFPDVLNSAVKFCCSDCVHGDTAAINFVGSNRTKSLRRGIIEVNQHLSDNIDFHFPIHGTKYKTTHGNGFPFVPLVHSPGAAFIISSNNAYNESERVMKTLLDSWTFILTLVLASYFVGLIMWFIVRANNTNICMSRVAVYCHVKLQLFLFAYSALICTLVTWLSGVWSLQF